MVSDRYSLLTCKGTAIDSDCAITVHAVIIREKRTASIGGGYRTTRNRSGTARNHNAVCAGDLAAVNGQSALPHRDSGFTGNGYDSAIVNDDCCIVVCIAPARDSPLIRRFNGAIDGQSPTNRIAAIKVNTNEIFRSGNGYIFSDRNARLLASIVANADNLTRVAARVR